MQRNGLLAEHDEPEDGAVAMAMKNFWIDAQMDGRKNNLRGGPSNARDAGFELKVRMRDEGESIVAYTIQGYADSSGQLVVRVYDSLGFEVDSERRVR